MERKQQQGSNVKSSFISQKSPEQKERTTHLTSRKQLSSSTFFDLEQSKPNSPTNYKRPCKDPEYLKHSQQQKLTRARSLKNIQQPKIKSLQLIQSQQLGALNESTLRLKAEELLFKLKVRLGSLLRELGCGEEEMSRFSHLGKVDEVVLFLSEHVRQALSEANKIADTTSTSSNKDRQALEQAQVEVETLKGKLAERENGQRNLKTRLKETHNQLKELYDRVNVKEKEYSQRTTQLYQIRMQMKEHQKTGELLKCRLQVLEKERNELKSLFDSAGKDHVGILNTLRNQNQQLLKQANELKEDLMRTKERSTKLQELNDHLKEELQRWRERAEYQGERGENQRQKSSEEGARTPNDLASTPHHDMKKSTMSVNSGYINHFNTSLRPQSQTALQIDNARLRLQLTQLTKQNEELQRSLLNYAPNKLKYQQTLQMTEVGQDLSVGLDQRKLQFLKERSGELYRLEIEGHYKRKTEQIAKEWKDKLFEIVCKYEDDEELLRAQITELKQQLQTVNKKLCVCANEKYVVQTRLIELQKEFYSLNTRSTKSLLSHSHPDDPSLEYRQSEEVILSNPRLLPIQEEESPRRRPEDTEENISALNTRQQPEKEANSL